MVTVTFPKCNRLLQKVFNTIMIHDNHDDSLLTHKEDVLDVILANLGFTSNEKIEIKVNPKYNQDGKESQKQYGQFITIKYVKDGKSGIHRHRTHPELN